jgi:hydroxyacylglutathione hydrolase
MFFKHIYETGLAQASYIIGCQASGEAIVIDPRRDIDVYLEIAEKEKLKITHITETHIHADFLSGTRELAAATSAQVMLSEEGGPDWQYQFDHIPLKEGHSFKVGNLLFEVIHTPGHTPEHISFLLTDTARSTAPVMIFTGDFVFVGDVGRPDLLEKAAGYIGTQEIGARQMFQSLKKFKSLPDHIQVWPAHGAGSACGKALGAVPSSTVGYEKFTNWALNIDDEEKFISVLLDGQPEPPKYFAMMKKLNKTGPQILGGLPHPARLTLPQFKSALEKEIRLVDTRDKLSYAGGHICKSINIQDNASFSTWAGWLLDYENPFMLVANDSNIDELTKSLIRIGLDNIHGYIANLDTYANDCHELETVNQLTVAELEKKMLTDEVTVIDVRGATEFVAGHIPGAKNIHLGSLLDKKDLLKNEKEIVLNCAGGDRSSIGVSLLLSVGIKNVMNLTGGFTAWQNEGKKIEREELQEVK